MHNVRNDVGQEFYDADAWDGESNKAKPMFDFLCGNHTRNLLAVRFEKRHDIFLEEELGEALRAAKTVSGGRARLECSGTHFSKLMQVDPQRVRPACEGRWRCVLRFP
jgi:hypothetical protein